MTTFWIICAVLVVAALLFVVVPLWRSSGKNTEVVRDAANLAILQDQAKELENDLKNGLLTQEAYEQGKKELEQRLLEEVKDTEAPATMMRSPSKVLAMTLAVVIPVVSLIAYKQLGSLEGVLVEPIVQQQAPEQEEIRLTQEDIKALEEKLKAEPNDPEGWWMMANVYTEQSRYDKAVEAYGNLTRLVPNEAQLWANYADVYAMKQNRSLQGEPTNLLKKALSLDPNNLTALALSGNAAMERADFVSAIKSWQMVHAQLPPGSPDAEMIMKGIEQAHEMMMQGREHVADAGNKPLDSLAGQADGAASKLTGVVTLSPELADKASPEDTVFILAKSAAGGRMPPLAVMRKQVKDLPMEFTLDDSMAMQPQFRLSAFDQVKVIARVSKAGTAMAQAGDLEGMSEVIKPGTEGLEIVINNITQ